MKPDYALAFLTGLLGGFSHCAGMCGPLVGALACRAGTGWRLLPHLLYHLGRIATYTFLGALMGYGGSFVETAGRLAGVQGAATLLAGALMVATGLAMLGVVRLPSPVGAGGWLRLARPLMQGGSAGAFFPLGLLFGLLPCGLSATVLLMAAGTANPAQGWLLALLLGVGTVPALLLVGLAAGGIGARATGLLQRAGGAVIVGMGLLLLRRGMAAHGGL